MHKIFVSVYSPYNKYCDIREKNKLFIYVQRTLVDLDCIQLNFTYKPPHFFFLFNFIVSNLNRKNNMNI